MPLRFRKYDFGKLIFIIGFSLYFFHAKSQCGTWQELVTIDITTDDFGSETTWELYETSSGAVIASGGPYLGNRTYQALVCVDTVSCYRFVIYDSFGDGMCCFYGVGSYSVYYGSNLMGTGGTFANSSTVYGIGNCGTTTPLVTDHTTYTPIELVTDVLLGSCVEAYNIEYNGAPAAVGYFSNGSSMGMETGLLLTTGNTDIGPGPNDNSADGYTPGTPGDSLLEAVTGYFPTHNAASFEFDFISFNDTVSFRYIFASEEYNEFVCSGFNDVFAFLVTGPGYVPNTNIALIPGTLDTVAINTVNNGTPGNFLGSPYDCDLLTTPHSLTNTAFFVDNTGGLITQFDGYTVPLTATMIVVPCDTYHIKLVIADVGDQLYDSGVFLEAESFSAGESIGIQASTSTGTKHAFEGCSDGTYTFFREDSSDITSQVTISFSLSGTAVEGVDFQPIPHAIVIPPNQYSASVSISTILDGTVEAPEQVILSYQDVCTCNLFKRDTLYIFDNLLLSANVTGPGLICQGQQATLTASGSGSFMTPYSYSWSNGETLASIAVSPSSSTTYTVTVTDFCVGQTDTASFLVDVAPAVNADFTFITPQCLSQLGSDFTNTSTYSGIPTFYWDLGDSTTEITQDITNHIYATSGTYDIFHRITVNGCSDSTTKTLVITNPVATNISATICEDNSFFAGGAFQDTSGVYYDTFSAANGCDSVVITNLTVLDTSIISVTVSICEGTSYFAQGTFQTVSGIYYDTIPNGNNCDSVIITDLTVIDTTVTNISIFICDGESYQAGGALQTISGVYYDTIPNANNCDSVIITDLTVLSNSAYTITVSICEGDSFLAGGAYQYASGSYFDILVSGNGCDSIITTNLTVLDTSITNVVVSICDGESYQAGGGLQTTSGIYYDTLPNGNNCDSVIITDLTVLSNSADTITVSMCEGDSFLAGGVYQYVSGSYFDILVSGNGCDSIVTTDLTVFDTSVINVAVSICDGESYLAGGVLQTTSGIYYDHIPDANNCDSVIITALTVLSNSVETLSISICEGDSFLAGGAYQYVSGSYFDILVSDNGCDSLVTTNLTVLDTSITNVTVSICEGASYQAGGGFQTTSGIYYDTIPNANNCDSIIITDLTVKDTSVTNISISICDGESYQAGGALQTTSGIYYDTIPNGNNCDSVVITDLIVLNNSAGTITVSICEGDSFLAGGAYQYISGSYFDILISGNGCDSIVTTNLTVLDASVVIVNALICDGESYAAGGGLQTTSGIYYDTIPNANNCDSIVVTNLTVLPTSVDTIAMSICEGDSFLAGGFLQTTTGIYYDTAQASNGCDSVFVTDLSVVSVSVDAGSDTSICDGESAQLNAIGALTYLWTPDTGLDHPDIANPIATPTVTTDYIVTSQAGGGSLICLATDTVTVTVLPNYDETVNVSICQGATHTLPDGSIVNSDGTYPVILTAANGCDSVIITEVSLVNSFSVQNNAAICRGDGYFAGGTFQTESGIYIDTFLSTGGCDSIVTTTLAVMDTFRINIAQSICQGDSFFVGGSWQKLSGTYFDNLTTAFNCDSIVATSLSIIPTVFSQSSPQICEGDSFFAGGAFQKNPGIYRDTFTLSNGCDSIRTTTLTVSNSYTIHIDEKICEGDSFYAGGSWQQTTGDYFDPFLTPFGCDSLIITHLIVDTTARTLLQVFICEGDSFFVGSGWQKGAGDYIDSLNTQSGCDSIVTTTLIVRDTFVTHGTVMICEGESLFVGGAWQNSDGIYVDTLQSIDGCDSTVVTTLSVLAIINTQIDTIICEGQSFFAGGALQTTSGVFIDSAIASGGCDSVNTTYLTVIEIDLSGDTAIVCPGAETTLSASGIFNAYSWLPGGESTSFITASAGTYQLSVTDSNNCSASADFLVKDADSIQLVAVPYTDTIIEGESTIIQIWHNPNAIIKSYQWTPSLGLNCETCDRVIATPDDDITYTVIATDNNECTEIVMIEVIVDTLLDPLVYVPNAFTPNGDGINDEFNIYGQGFEYFHLRVFNRWGELLFESYDRNTGWNGTYRGKDCIPGVYVYHVDAKFIRDERLSDYTTYRKGSVTLIR